MILARPTPARPAERSSANVRLLAIAADHVRRFGARRLTVVAVAEAAGMTHANVYRYFPSREALLDAVANAALRPVEALLSDIAGAPDPADDKLERMVLALARAYRDLLEHDAAAFGIYAEAVEGNRGIARRHRGRARMLFERVVDEGVATGVFSVRDRQRALSFLTDALFRFTHPAAVRLDGSLPRAALEPRLATMVAVALRTLTGNRV